MRIKTAYESVLSLCGWWARRFVARLMGMLESTAGLVRRTRVSAGVFGLLALVSLSGGGPWSIVATRADGTADTLANSISVGQRIRAEFVPIAELPPQWKLPNSAVDPWSPDGARLAIKGPDGLYVFDTTSPQRSPWRVLDARVEYFQWSPDGLWLLCRVPVGDGPVSEYADLVAVRSDGHLKSVIASKVDVSGFLWSGDGSIYIWYANNLIQRTFAAPGGRLSHSRKVRPARNELIVLISTIGNNALHTFRFRPGVGIDRTPLRNLPAATTMLLPRATLAGGTQFLATLHSEVQSPRNVVVGLDGAVLKDLGSTVGSNGYTATSMSPDGRYALGSKTTQSGEDIVSASLLLVDVESAQRTNILCPSGGITPRFSPTNYRLVYTDLISKVIRIGVLKVTPR